MLFVAVAAALLSTAYAGDAANEKLKKCCTTITGGDQECIDKFCDFSAISQTNILNYLSKCTEKGPTVGMMWDCASTRFDHTECCKAKGVEGKCLEYCAAHDGVPTNYLDYLFCTESFNQIRDCFVAHLDKTDGYDHKNAANIL